MSLTQVTNQNTKAISNFFSYPGWDQSELSTVIFTQGVSHKRQKKGSARDKSSFVLHSWPQEVFCLFFCLCHVTTSFTFLFFCHVTLFCCCLCHTFLFFYHVTFFCRCSHPFLFFCFVLLLVPLFVACATSHFSFVCFSFVTCAVFFCLCHVTLFFSFLLPRHTACWTPWRLLLARRCG